MAILGFETKEIAQQAILAKKNVLTPISSFSFGVDSKNKGQTVDVPVIGLAGASAAFVAGSNDYSHNGTGTTAMKSVVLDTDLKSPGFTLTYDQAKRITPSAFQQLVESEIQSLAAKCLDTAFAKVLAATYTTTAVDVNVADFDRDSIVDLRAAIKAAMGTNDNNMMFNVHLNSAFYNALEKDATLAQIFAYAGANIVETAGVPVIKNCKVFESAVPANGENLKGFICDPTAFALAFGLEEGSEDKDTVITDPTTGISFVLHHEDLSTVKKHSWALNVVMAAVPVNTNALVRLIDTP